MYWLFKNYIKCTDKLKYYSALIINIFGDIIARIWPVIFIGKIIDEGLIKNDYNAVIKYFLLSIILYATGITLAYWGVAITEKLVYRISNKIGETLYNKINFMDNDYFKHTNSGEINTLFQNDMKHMIRLLTYTLKQFSGEVLTAIFSIIYCIKINIPLTIIFLCFIPIYLILIFTYNKKSKILYETERLKVSKLNQYLQENIKGNKLIKNLGTEEKEIESFKEINTDYINYKIKINYKMYNYMEFMKLLSQIIWIVLIAIGGFFIMKGQITIGQFLIFNSLVNGIASPIYNLVDYTNDWRHFKVSVDKMKLLMNTNPKQKDKGSSILQNINNIQFNNVNVEIDNKTILKNININLEENKTYAFIGEVGSGKSTIGKLILRLIDNTTGEILINNKNIQDYTISSIRRKIGYVSQTPFLFSDTIKNNVNFGNLELTNEEIEYYLKLAKADYVKNLENGINTIIGENGVNLSGGEKQRLSLARAIAIKPQILILDDITSALDYETELEVSNNINNLDYKCMKIIIAQKIISIKNADKIFVIKSGEIIGEGTHEELLNNCNMYKEIYEIQSGKNAIFKDIKEK